MQATAVVIERIAVAEWQCAVDRERGLPGLFQPAINVEIERIGRVADQADQRLELRHRRQDAGRLDGDVRQLRRPIAADAVAVKKVRLQLQLLRNHRQDGAGTAAAAPDCAVRKRGAAAEQAADAIELVMAPAGLEDGLRHHVRRNVSRILGQRVEMISAGVADGRRYQRRVRTVKEKRLRAFQ